MSRKNHIFKRAFLLSLLFSVVSTSVAYAAYPSSASYKIQEYSFGAGGGKGSSATYGIEGIAGEVEFGRPGSSSFKVGSGLTYIMKAPVPPAPTFTNAGGTYDRLTFVINPNGVPTDITFAVQVSTDSAFLTDVNYVKNTTNLLGSTLTLADFQTYSAWGGASGTVITGLKASTTYYMRVKARQGNYTESEYGPSASAATIDPSLTFSVNSNTVTFNNLNSGNSYTDATKSTIVTTSTNAYNGYIVNARSTGPLTASSSATIPDYSSPNSAPTAWSGNGFGYTTSDSSLTGGTANRFTNAGPNYAGFTTSSPGDPVADTPGPITSAISNQNFTISYKVQTSNIQAAGKYTTTILYIVVPSY